VEKNKKWWKHRGNDGVVIAEVDKCEVKRDKE
jgi:hypothetical protein